MRGITLEEIAEATKIGTRSLRALEQQDFDKLPGGIFNKGFVRAYARYLGLDEEQAVTDYMAALNDALAAGKALRQEPPDRNQLVDEVDDGGPSRLPLGLLAIVVVLVVLVFSAWRYIARNGLPKLRHVRAAADIDRPAARAPAPAEAAAQPVRPSPPSSSSAIPAAAAQPAATSEAFVVRIRAKQSSWVSVTADDKLVLEETLPAGADKSIRAQRNLRLKAGNVAAIELFHNDKPVAVSGRDGEVKTLEFTAAGLRP